MTSSISRRAVTAAFLAVSALLTVTACRVEQGAALFIGDTRYQQDEIAEIVDSVPADDRDRLGNLFESTGGAMTAITPGMLRGYTLDALTVIDLGKDVVASTEDAAPSQKAAEAAEEFWTDPIIGLSKDSKFVSLMTEAESYRAVLFAGAEPAQPSEEEIERQAAQLQALGRPMEGPQLAELSQLLDGEDGRSAIGNMHQVEDLLDEHQVEANPRYGGAYVIIGRDQYFQPLVTAAIPS